MKLFFTKLYCIYWSPTAVILPTKFPQVSLIFDCCFSIAKTSSSTLFLIFSHILRDIYYSYSLESVSPGRASCSTALLVQESLFSLRPSPPKPTQPSSPCPPLIWYPNGKERVRNWSSRCSRWPARPSRRLSSSMRLIRCARLDLRERASPRDASRRSSSCRLVGVQFLVCYDLFVLHIVCAHCLHENKPTSNTWSKVNQLII